MPLYAAAASGLLSELPEEVRESLLNLIILPPVVFSVALAYLSGHVWAYVIFARIFPDATAKSAENRQTQYIRFVLDHNIGRVALGLLWLALWLLVLTVLPWLVVNRNLLITTDYITGRLPMIWILAMASEAALSVILLFIPARASDGADRNAQAAQNKQDAQDAKKDAKKDAPDTEKDTRDASDTEKDAKDAKTDGESAQKENQEEKQNGEASPETSDSDGGAERTSSEKSTFQLDKTAKTAKTTKTAAKAKPAAESAEKAKAAAEKKTAKARETASKAKTVRKTTKKSGE